MTGKPRMLGVALAAVLAMSAVVAANASATSEYWFRTDGSPTTLSGSQTVESGDVFKVDGGEVKCNTISYSGSQSGTTATSVNLNAAHSGCTFTGALTSTVDMKSCYYVLHRDGDTTNGKFDVRTTIECSKAGDEITITAENAQGVTKCIIHVPAQDVGTGMVLTNNEALSELSSHISLSSIKYSQTEGTGIGKCPTADSTSNGTYSGAAVLKGKNGEGSATAIWVEGGPILVEFNSEAEHTTVIGEDSGTEEFVVSAGTAKCTEAVYRGTMEGKAASEIVLNPEYGGCTAFGFSSAEVKVNSCTYTFHSGEETFENVEGELDIGCPGGKSIEIVAKVLGLTKCVVTIGAQSGLTAITYTNEGSGTTRDVEVDLGVTGINYTQDTGEGLGKCSSGTFETGKYNGSLTAIGESTKKAQVGFWIE